MKRRSKIGLVILSSFAFVGLSAGVGYAVWSVINIKNTLTPTEQFYTVNFYNGSALTKSLTGLEQDSFFSTPFLSDDTANHAYFVGWKEQNGTKPYKGSVSLSSFQITNYVLNLYASFEKQVTFQVTTVLGETVQADSTYTVPVRISDPYLFPMFNLNLTIPEGYSIHQFEYNGTDTSEVHVMKRTANGYSESIVRVFNINDALYLGGNKCHFNELKAGGSFVLPIQAKFTTKS
ncbi:MAG: hypothetical protein PUE65_00885 [Mollicutes bacterium]|nr:hypothetical protein [Mollicutes bacterium]